MTEAPSILYEIVRPHVARITLNRPESRNAQSTRLLYELNDAFDRAATDVDVKVIILAAAGPHFSSGHDLREQGGDPKKIHAEMEKFPSVLPWAGYTAEGAEGTYARESELYVGLCKRWRDLPKPTIAQVQGKVVAGGLMLVWPCDIVIASEDAMFMDNTVAMGIGGCEYFAHPWELGVRKAKQMLFTADWLTAQEAHRLGMVNEVVPRPQLEAATLELAEKIARKPAFTLKLVKQAVNAAQDAQGLASAMQTAFGLHQLAHAHWREIAGIPVDPDFMRNSRQVEEDSPLKAPPGRKPI